MNKKILIGSIITIIIIGILSYQITLRYLSEDETTVTDENLGVDENIPKQENEVDKKKETDHKIDNTETKNEIDNNEDVIETDYSQGLKITPSTRIVYQTYYTVDDKIETYESEPPYYLINMTREEMEKYYTDWQLISFSDKKVVLRKSLEERNPSGYYIIKEYDGLIAVYYDYLEDLSLAFENAVAAGQYQDDELDKFTDDFLNEYKDNYLREIINTPINLLSEEEQEKLKEGILVFEDDLIAILENYTS